MPRYGGELRFSKYKLDYGVSSLLDITAKHTINNVPLDVGDNRKGTTQQATMLYISLSNFEKMSEDLCPCLKMSDTLLQKQKQI